LRHKISEITNIGEDKTNNNDAHPFCFTETFLDITAIATASDGVHDKKKNTNDKKTVIIIIVSCSFIIPPMPLQSTEATMLPRITPTNTEIIVG